METRIIKSKTAELEVFIYNEEESDTLLLINGGPGIAYYLDDLALKLSKIMRVVSYNQRGMGMSNALNNSYAFDDYLNDLLSIAESLKLQKFHLFGHAWGGLVAQIFTMKNPQLIKSVFLCNSFIGIGKAWCNMEGEIFDFFTNHLNQRKLFLFNMLVNLNRVKALSAYATKRLIYIMSNSYFRGFKYNSVESLKRKLVINPKVFLNTRLNIINKSTIPENDVRDIPILILFGSKDICNEENWRLEERWPAAQVVKLKKAGHFPWLETPNEFKQIVCSFYQEGTQ